MPHRLVCPYGVPGSQRRSGARPWAGIAAVFFAAAVSAGNLPDTGQASCYNGTSLVVCDASNSGDGSAYPRQDGRYGRDAAFAQGVSNKAGGGQQGFDYTKRGASGTPLGVQNAAWAVSGGYDSGSEATGTKWSCVTDNITELTWEIKTYDATPGLRDRQHTYTWYSTDGASNGGNAGSSGYNTCSGTLPGNQCNTQAYVGAINTAGLCGFSDWRLPSFRELLTLAHSGNAEPSIDTDYFPNTVSTLSSAYWSADTVASEPGAVWMVMFRNGGVNGYYKSEPFALRLVRGAAL